MRRGDPSRRQNSVFELPLHGLFNMSRCRHFYGVVMAVPCGGTVLCWKVQLAPRLPGIRGGLVAFCRHLLSLPPLFPFLFTWATVALLDAALVFHRLIGAVPVAAASPVFGM